MSEIKLSPVFKNKFYGIVNKNNQIESWIYGQYPEQAAKKACALRMVQAAKCSSAVALEQPLCLVEETDGSIIFYVFDVKIVTHNPSILSATLNHKATDKRNAQAVPLSIVREY